MQQTSGAPCRHVSDALFRMRSGDLGISTAPFLPSASALLSQPVSTVYPLLSEGGRCDCYGLSSWLLKNAGVPRPSSYSKYSNMKRCLMQMLIGSLCFVAEKVYKLLLGLWYRDEDEASMRERLVELVNSVITSQGATPLSEGQILDLIDTGSSQGGSQVCSRSCVL